MAPAVAALTLSGEVVIEFTFVETVPRARPLLFRTLRDRVEELVPHMKNAVGITERSRGVDARGVVTREAIWRGAPEEVPALIRPMVRPEALVWVETTRWDERDWTCEWTIRLPVMAEVFTARGRNAFLAEGEGSRVEMAGEFSVHPEALPSVPTLPPALVRTVVPPLERFVVALLDPNLKEAVRAARRFLDQE